MNKIVYFKRDDDKEEGHVHFDGIDWTSERLKTAVAIKPNAHKGH